MTLLTNPQNYEICFAICSMVVLLITVFVHLFGEHYYSRQNDIFGGLLFNAFCMNLLGLIHKVWIQSEFFKMFLSYQAACVLVILEKMCIYIMPLLSVLYGMAIFRIEFQSFVKKILIGIPTICSQVVIFSVIFTGFFYRFDEMLIPGTYIRRLSPYI